VGGHGRVTGDAEGFTLTLTGHPVLRRPPPGLWGPALEGGAARERRAESSGPASGG